MSLVDKGGGESSILCQSECSSGCSANIGLHCTGDWSTKVGQEDPAMPTSSGGVDVQMSGTTMSLTLDGV